MIIIKQSKTQWASLFSVIVITKPLKMVKHSIEFLNYLTMGLLLVNLPIQLVTEVHYYLNLRTITSLEGDMLLFFLNPHRNTNCTVKTLIPKDLLLFIIKKNHIYYFTIVITSLTYLHFKLILQVFWLFSKLSYAKYFKVQTLLI